MTLWDYTYELLKVLLILALLSLLLVDRSIPHEPRMHEIKPLEITSEEEAIIRQWLKELK